MLRTKLLLFCVCLFVAKPTFTIYAAPAEADKEDKKADDKKSDEKKDEPKDTTSVTQHTATIGGKEIKYTATAGKLVMKDDEGKAKAQVFFIAYTKNGVEDLGQRADYVCVQRRAGVFERVAAPGHVGAAAGEGAG